VGGAIALLANWFADLPGPIQAVVAIMGGLAAAAGPVVMIAGTLIKNWQTLTSVFKLSAGAFSGAGLALGAIGVVAVVAYLGIQRMRQHNEELKARTDEVTQSLLEQANQTFRVAFESAGAESAISGLAAANEALNNSILAGEGGEKIALSMGQLGLQTKDALKWLVLLADQGGTNEASLIALAGAAGYSGDQLMLLAGVVNSVENINEEGMFKALALAAMGMGMDADAAKNLATELLPAALAMEEMQDQSENLAEDGTLAKAATEFLNLAASASPAGAAMVEAAEGLAQAGRGSDQSVEVFKKFGELLAQQEQPTQDAILGTGDLAVANEALQTAVEGSTGAIEEQEGVAGSSIDTLSDYAQAFDDVASAASRFSDAISTVVDPQRDWVNASEALWENVIKFNDAIDESSTSTNRQTEAGQQNREVIEDWADDIWAATEAQLANGGSVEDVTNAWWFNRKALYDTAIAAGFTEDQITSLLKEYGLTPEDLVTVVQLEGDRAAREKVQELLNKYDDIPPDIATHIQTLIDAGEYRAAAAALNALTIRRAVSVDVYANTSPASAAIRALAGIPISVVIRAIGVAHSAEGRYVPGGSNMLSTLGENSGSGGDEVVLPLGNPSRMSQLLGMAEVGPRVMAALGGLRAGGDGRGLTPAATGGGSTVHNTNFAVTVNMPPGSNGDDVVRALRQWQRRGGPIPVSVR
jgi:hypothetical protein